jgi:hypothetical protein
VGAAAAIETNWTAATSLWIRRALELTVPTKVILRGRVENACYVFFDGTYIGSYNPDNDQLVSTPEWLIAVPPSLATIGVHELALLCADELDGEGGNTYISVVAEEAPTLMPFQPRAPMSETLSWLTDIQTSKDGTEDRAQMRISARQSLRMNYPLGNENMRRGFNMIYGRRHGQWTVPLWHQAQHIGAVSAGEFTISAEPDYSEFREGDYALLWQSPTQLQLLSVAGTSGSSITFYNLTEEFTDAWLMPARVGFIPENPRKVLTGHRSELEVRFQIEDNVALTVSAPTQYLSNDIYYDETLLSGDTLSDDIVGNFDLQDEELGIVSYYAPWLYTKVAHTHRVVAEGPVEAWALRQWLYRRAGRLRPFWQPSFEDDLRVVSTGALTTTLDVLPDDYLNYAGDRTHIAVQTKAGWLPRAITGTELVSENVLRLTLDTSLATNASNIIRVCWLGLKRLNTDSVDLNWPGAGVCELEVRLLEIEP